MLLNLAKSLAVVTISLVITIAADADDVNKSETTKEIQLSAFATDGCSDFPDGTPEYKTLWLNCCIEHDLAYWLGGTQQQRIDADEALKTCVAAVGEPEIAALMLAGVRVGGSPFWPTPYRWGYGWPYWDGPSPRGYKVMTDAEKEQAEALRPTDIQIDK